MIDTKLLRQKILDLAIRGKLVPQDKSDEPASVLLERIRKEKAELAKQGKIKKSKQESFIYKNPSDNRHYENVGGKVTDIEDQIPFKIPDSWAWVRIREAFIVNPRNCIPDDLEVAFISMPLICDGFRNAHDQGKKFWKDVKNGFTHFAEGDIGVAKITPCFENLKSVIFTSLLNGYGAGTTELHIFRSIISLPTLSEYALSFFKSLHFTANAPFSGQVGQQRVPRAYFEDALFPMPPQNVLERIVQQIKNLFRLIDNLEREQDELSNLATLAKSKILDLAMRGKLVPQDPNDEPASELLNRLSSSHKPHYEIAVKPFEIPLTWQWYPLGNFASIIGGVSYDKSDIAKGGIRILRGGNIQNGALVLESDDIFLLEKYNDNDNTVKCGDIVIVGSTGSDKLIGKAGFALKTYENTQIGAFLRIIRPQPYIADYLRLIFKSDYYTSYICSKAKGTNINNIKNNYLSEFAIPVPPENEQKCIVKIAGNMISLAESLRS